MKAQLVFQFVIAAVVFFAVMFFTISFLASGIGERSVDASYNLMWSEAIALSEQMVRSPGSAEGLAPTAIGFAASWPLLDSEKLGFSQTLCSQNRSAYESIFRSVSAADVLDASPIPGPNFRITISEVRDGAAMAMFACGSRQEPARKAFLRRVALSQNNSILVADVSVW
ncbi:MAG: hypothetical protein HY519_01215 [Candidatus Aenigmarchaeota archaeon]|nr:hypothetical protein [Candidatus Aenigmarchaeota archaeon]